jgi:hypothetical protein
MSVIGSPTIIYEDNTTCVTITKRFVVPAVKSIFVSVSPADTILMIQKIDHFLYRLFPVDT